MEYLIGSLFTFAMLLVIANITQRRVMRLAPIRPIRYSQTYIFSLLSPLLPYSVNMKPFVSQATKHLDSKHLRVFIDFDKAYWIKNNRLYSADVIDGIIIQETEKEVDTMTVNKVELNKLTFIVEKLTEGLDNDSSSSGN